MKITPKGHPYLAMGGGDLVFLVWADCGRRVWENEHQLTETNGKLKAKNSENQRKWLLCGCRPSLGSGLCSRMNGRCWEVFPGWTEPRGQTTEPLEGKSVQASLQAFLETFSIFYFISSSMGVRPPPPPPPNWLRAP